MRWWPVVVLLASCDAVFGLKQTDEKVTAAACPAPYEQRETGFYRIVDTLGAFGAAEDACRGDETAVAGLTGHTHLVVLSGYRTTGEHNVVYQLFADRHGSSAQFWV